MFEIVNGRRTDGRTDGRTHTVIKVNTCGSCNIISRKPQQHDRLGTASTITGAFTGLLFQVYSTSVFS